jgi:hypothetical protein
MEKSADPIFSVFHFRKTSFVGYKSRLTLKFISILETHLIDPTRIGAENSSALLISLAKMLVILELFSGFIRNKGK